MPYLCFLCIGFEHYLENFFLIGCSLMYGIDGSIAKFLFVNIIGVGLGNIIGICGVISVVFSEMFFTKEE